MLQCNYRFKELDLKNVPPFYVRLLEFWEVTHLAGKGDLSPNETIIWNNKHIKINNTSVFFLAWFRKRLNKIKDLRMTMVNFFPLKFSVVGLTLKLALQHITA